MSDRWPLTSEQMTVQDALHRPLVKYLAFIGLIAALNIVALFSVYLAGHAHPWLSVMTVLGLIANMTAITGWCLYVNKRSRNLP